MRSVGTTLRTWEACWTARRRKHPQQGLGTPLTQKGNSQASMCFDERPCVVGEIAVDGEVSEKEIENVSDELSERDFGLHVSPVGDVGAG